MMDGEDEDTIITITITIEDDDEYIQPSMIDVAADNAVTPNRMAASNIIGIFNHYHHGGCFYVKGGGQALSDAFISVIEECGGKVRRRNEVKSILTNSNGAATTQPSFPCHSGRYR